MACLSGTHKRIKTDDVELHVWQRIRSNKKLASQKALGRSLKLLIVGLIIQGTKPVLIPRWDPPNTCQYLLQLAFQFENLMNKRTCFVVASSDGFRFPDFGLVLAGGYFHGLHNTSYGVDLERIRWCGVLQVINFPSTLLTVVNLLQPKATI